MYDSGQWFVVHRGLPTGGIHHLFFAENYLDAKAECERIWSDAKVRPITYGELRQWTGREIPYGHDAIEFVTVPIVVYSGNYCLSIHG